MLTTSPQQTLPDACAAELRRMVIAWLQDAKPLDWSGAADLSKEELAAALSALGYITSDSDEVSEGHVWFDTGCPCAWCAAFPAQGTP